MAQTQSTVEVSASAVSVDTTSSSLTAVVNTSTVQDLPMNGRNFRQMIKLVPGASAAQNSINGSRTNGNNLSDRRRGQQRRVSEHVGRQSGRRRGHCRNAAAD